MPFKSTHLINLCLKKRQITFQKVKRLKSETGGKLEEVVVGAAMARSKVTHPKVSFQRPSLLSTDNKISFFNFYEWEKYVKIYLRREPIRKETEKWKHSKKRWRSSRLQKL